MELVERCRHHLVIECEETEKAVWVLEEILHTNRYKVLQDKSIWIDDFIENRKLVMKALVEQGILPTKFVVEGETLENYFLSVIGGGRRNIVVSKSIEVLLISMVLYAARLSFCIPLAFKIKKAVVVTVAGIVLGFLSDFFVILLSKVPVLDTILEYTPFSHQIITMDMSQGELIKILIILCIVLFFYILFLRRQVGRINRILKKRLKNGSSQIISLEMLDSRLNQLTISIYQCLKAEETLRLKVVHEENDFKQLIANISHELRTPLTAIKGYLQLLEKDTLAQKQQVRIKIMNTHIAELEYLINQFYEYAYLLDSKPEVEISSFSLSNVVAECLAASVPELEKRGLTLDFEESNVWVEADYNMTLRIIQNLLRNCVAHANKSVSF